MNVGALFGTSRPITWADIANSKQVPIFFSALYDKSRKQNVTEDEANVLWNYLDDLQVGFSRSSVEPAQVGQILQSLLPAVTEAVAEAAAVVGQLTTHGGGPVVQEMLFFVFAYFNEINMSQPTDMTSYLRQSGSILAKYVDGFNDVNVDTSRVTTPIKKMIWDVVRWFKSMVRSNYLIVHHAMFVISACAMQTMSHQFFELGCVMEFEKPKASLVKLLEVATNMSKMSDMPRKTKAELLERVQQLETYRSLLDEEKPGFVEPWMVAAVMKSVYYGERVDPKIASAIVRDRTGKSLKEFQYEIDVMVSGLKTQIWKALFSYASDAKQVETYLSEIVQIEGRWNIFGWEDDPEDSEDEEEKAEKASKGKEEDENYAATDRKKAEREQQKARRRLEREKQRLDHFARLEEAKMDTLKKAAQSDVDNPYDPNLKSEADFQAAKERVHARSMKYLRETSTRVSQLKNVQRDIENRNIQLNAVVSAKALESYNAETGIVVIKEAIDALEEIGQDAEEHVRNYLTEHLYRLHLFEFMIGVLNKREQELHGRVIRSSAKYGSLILFIALAGAFIWFVYKMNMDLVTRTTATLADMRNSTAKTYTTSVLGVWEKAWTEQYTEAQKQYFWRPVVTVQEYDLTPETIRNIAGNAIARLSTFVTENIDLNAATTTIEYIRRVTQNYVTFIRTYIEGLEGALSETALHIAVLQNKGHDATSTLLQEQMSLKAMIYNALLKYKEALDVPSLQGLTQDQLRNQLIALQDRIARSTTLIQETYRALDAKMLTGSVPATVNLFVENARRLDLNLLVPQLFGATVSTAKAAYDWVISKAGPSIEDLSPYGLARVMGPGGRSSEWMDILKKMGDAGINIVVGCFAIPFLFAAHLGTAFARQRIGHMDPISVWTRFFIETTASISGIWHLIWYAISEAAIGQFAAKWGIFAGMMGLLVMFFPSFGLFQKGMDWVTKKRASITPLPQQSTKPPPPTTPAEEEKPAEPIVVHRPTQANPNVFITPPSAVPQIEPPVMDVPQIVTEQDNALALEIAERLQEAKRKRAAKKKQEDASRFQVMELPIPFVQCHVCGDEAHLMCSHCYKKSYCNQECGKLDWSTRHNTHNK